ncbi:hypothetical protein [Gimibacter soli]|uniref:Uncharacterized protein n=1 Tax=Gimibacter soli TaxID=3024400 RepID=A0AAE9XU75_9PROT|nr:hypothetical protein [Gimibacter soli]WCL55405.1 hypothetical protein PH603_06490 [Gimibacter soli]
MTLHQFRARLSTILPLLAVMFVAAQVMLVAHLAAFGPDKHLHGSEPCAIVSVSKAHDALDVASPPQLILPEAGAVIEILPVLALVATVRPARSSRDPPVSA